MLKQCNDIAHNILNQVQRVISSPFWFFGNIIITATWFVVQYILPVPWDPPKDFFPFTVLAYTLMTQWIENAVKVQQSLLQEAQQKQDTQTADQISKIEKMVGHIDQLVRESARRDAVMVELINALDLTVDKILDIQKSGGDGTV